ncbi:NUDIX domain-containing protein [bacterium]|nr:NUDIX domain-containing protein [candidate division CSSED10-310 bacterium]
MSEINSSISSDSISSHRTFPEASIIHLCREYNGYFNIEKALIRQPRLDGSGFREVTRYVFERGDCAGLLLHDPKKRKVLLVRQYRFPPLLRKSSGWFLEIVAGSVNPEQNIKDAAIKEACEETGLMITSLNELGIFFLSPGGSSERCFLYEATIDSTNVNGRICGEVGTSEDILVEIHSLGHALKMISSGLIKDAKTIIALQYLALGMVNGW